MTFRVLGVKNRLVGLTLIELLVSLSVLAILVCCSFSFSPSLYKKNQLQRVTDDIKSAIRFAKMQALLTGDIVALTPIATTGGWSEGMLLFVDNVKHRYVSGGTLLHQWRWTLSGIQVSWHGFQSGNYLLFTPDISSSTVNGEFIITNHIQQQVILVVNRLGRVKEKGK